MTLGDIVPWGKKGKRNTLPISGNESPIWALQSEMNRMFENFFSGWGIDTTRVSKPSLGSFTPNIDVEENDREFRIVAELPGMEKGDVDLTLTKEALKLRGEKYFEREEKEANENRYYSERTYGSFERVIPLTVEIDEDNVDASFKNGVLTVVLPKSVKAQREQRKITVRSA